MTTLWKTLALTGDSDVLSPAGELKVDQEALERTLTQQLFSRIDGKYFLKGGPKSACSVYADDPHLSFVGDRIEVGAH